MFLLLMVATLLLYTAVLDLGFFHLDDPNYVTKNPLLRSLTWDNLRQILTEPYFANYSPMHILSYLLDYSLAGANPWVFHLSSILWAGVTAGLVYLLAVALTGRRTVAVAAGVLFVTHPAHVEAIAWISSRKDLVAAAFALVAILMYIRYRRGRRSRWRWYAGTVILFGIAVAGKLSVVVVPAILLGFDYFIEKRRNMAMFVDKIPFALIAMPFALTVMTAQPPTRHALDIYRLGYVFTQCWWLLTGFGDYVIYRAIPEAIGPSGLLHLLLLGGVLTLPFVLRHRVAGLALALAYWIVLSMIPSQILSFIHPVTDRYLFFPSVAVTVLVAWGVTSVGKQGKTTGKAAALCIIAILAAAWTYKTRAYLEEWNDPRSVWHGAAAKSEDTNIYQFLGSHYQTSADSLAQHLAAGGRAGDQARALAQVVWRDDSRLTDLLDEWEGARHDGPISQVYQSVLRGMAWDEFERALAVKGKRVRPNLFFRRAKLQFDTGNLKAARREFLRAYEESRQHTFGEFRQEMAVRCHHALGVIAWREGDLEEALRLFTMARELQTEAGTTWVPGIDGYIRRLQPQAEVQGSK
jgi:hypothetical protein